MTKTIAVIGANGRSGRVFVKKALEHGYHVRAGVRKHHTLETHKNLVVIHCDASNIADVQNLLFRADYVVSLIGHSRHSPSLLQTTATKIITQVMNEYRQTRFVSLTGTGVRVKGDRPSWIDRLANWIISHIDPDRVNDGIHHVEFLRTTSLDWTVLRVLKLTNSTHSTSSLQLSLHGPAALLASRYQVADSILDIIESGTYYHELPILGGCKP